MAIQNEYSLLDELEDKIWLTKKCRIEAESRMKRWEMFYMISLNWMSIVTLLFSVISIQLNDNNLDNYGLYISIALIGITIISLNLNFSNKAKDFKNSYIQMEKVVMDIKVIKVKINNSSIKSDQVIKKIEDFQHRYSEILENTDNHLTIDFKQALRIIAKTNSKTESSKSNNSSSQHYLDYKAQHNLITRTIHFLRYYMPSILLFILIISTLLLILLFYTRG